MKFLIKMYCDSDEEFSNEDIKEMVNENMLQYIDCAPFVVEKVDIHKDEIEDWDAVSDPDLSYDAFLREAAKSMEETDET